MAFQGVAAYFRATFGRSPRRAMCRALRSMSVFMRISYFPLKQNEIVDTTVLYVVSTSYSIINDSAAKLYSVNSRRPCAMPFPRAAVQPFDLRPSNKASVSRAQLIMLSTFSERSSGKKEHERKVERSKSRDITNVRRNQYVTSISQITIRILCLI